MTPILALKCLLFVVSLFCIFFLSLHHYFIYVLVVFLEASVIQHLYQLLVLIIKDVFVVMFQLADGLFVFSFQLVDFLPFFIHGMFVQHNEHHKDEDEGDVGVPADGFLGKQEVAGEQLLPEAFTFGFGLLLGFLFASGYHGFIFSLR